MMLALHRSGARFRAARMPLVAAVLLSALAFACKPGVPTGLGAPPARIDIDVAAVALTTAGESAILTAVARDDDGFPIAGITFRWSSSDESVATVDANGVVTAVGSGIAIITASVDGVSSTPVTVTVRLPVVAIQVEPQGLNLGTIGETRSLTATALDASGAEVPGVRFTWTSTNTTVATVSSSGTVTAVSSGTASVTAAAEGQTSNSVAIAVMLAVASIDVTPGSASLTFVGETADFSATARDAGGSVVAGVTFTWASSNPSVADVSASGVVTAIANGSTAITASVGTVSSADATVTVQQVAVTISVSPTTLNFTSLGDTASLSAVARDAGGAVIPGATFTWNSTATGVATVSNTGLVTARGNGAANVTAARDGVTSNGVAVDVQQVVASISVTPASVSINAIGQTAQLTATALDAGGSPVSGVSFTWVSSNTGVATVSQTGLVTAVAAGVAQVTASEPGGIVSNAASVRVIPAQIVFDAASSTATVNSSSLSWAHTIGGGQKRVLVVGVTAEAASSSAVDVSSVTYNGIDLAKQVDESITAGFTSNAEIWVIDENRLPSAGTYSVVVTFQGTVAEAASGAISLENVNQGSPEATAANALTLQQSISTDITTQSPQAWVVDVVHAGTPGSFTPGAGQIERFDTGLAGSRAAGSTIEVVPPGRVTVSQTLSITANRLVHVAIALRAQ